MTRLHCTPLPLLATKYGSVPHLTRDTLKHVHVAEHAPLLAAYQHHVNQVKVLEKYGKGKEICLYYVYYVFVTGFYVPTIYFQ